MTEQSHSGEPRSALITGAASGIGRALTEELAEQGYVLHLVDIDADALAGAATSVSARTATCESVADPGAVQNLADQIGAVDLLCLNAGVTSTSAGAPWEAPLEEWDRVLGVNLYGVVNGLRSFIPPMLDRTTPSSILITASLAGAATWPGGGPYAASKHAVLAIAEQAALALFDSHISVTVLCPALVRSGMSADGRDPADVAVEALNAVADRRFAVVPPEWAAAVELRAETLVAGSQPEIPQPNSMP